MQDLQSSKDHGRDEDDRNIVSKLFAYSTAPCAISEKCLVGILTHRSTPQDNGRSGLHTGLNDCL